MRVCNFISVVFAICSLPKETLRISRNPKARFSLLIKIPLRIEIFNKIFVISQFCSQQRFVMIHQGQIYSSNIHKCMYVYLWNIIQLHYERECNYNSYMLYIVLLHFFKQFFGVAMEQGTTYKMCVWGGAQNPTSYVHEMSCCGQWEFEFVGSSSYDSTCRKTHTKNRFVCFGELEQ